MSSVPRPWTTWNHPSNVTKRRTVKRPYTTSPGAQKCSNTRERRRPQVSRPHCPRGDPSARYRDSAMPGNNTDHSIVRKMALRKALRMKKGAHRQISNAEADIIVLKLLEELHVAGYEIVKKPGNAGFTFETPGGDGSV